MLLPDEKTSDTSNEALTRLRPQELAALLFGALALVLGGFWLSSLWSIPLVGWLPLIVGGLTIVVVRSAETPWRD